MQQFDFMKIRNILSEFRLYVCNHIIAHVPSHSIRLFYYRKAMGFEIGKGSTIYMNCRFDSTKGLEIGIDSVINGGCRIDTRGSVKIGSNVSISEDVVILTADHDELFDITEARDKKVTIEDYVWVGTRAMILPGTNIAFGAVVAASATVTKDVATCNVVAGIPAKFIKMRADKFDYSAKYRRLFQ